MPYQLPARTIPEDVRDTLHPWIAGFIGLTPAEATKRLHDRWSTIERPSLRALRDTLSEFEVRAIVNDMPGGMIYAVRPNAEEGMIGNSFYLPGPLEPSAIDSHMISVALADNECVREFLAHFGGLAEDTDVSGNFVYSESPWPTFTDSWDGSIDGFDEWKNSLMIFVARNGCHVLVHPSGKVAWWVMQERMVKDLATSFDDFVIQFNEHRKLAWPYDPYGPAD